MEWWNGEFTDTLTWFVHRESLHQRALGLQKNSISCVALLADESDLLSFAPVLPHGYTLADMAVSCFLELVSQSTGELGSLSLAKTKMGD